MTKIEFPKSRVCAINFETGAELGVSKAISFAKSNGINLFGKDGRNILMASILDELIILYNSTTSKHSKVLVIHNNAADRRIKNLAKSKEFKRIVELLPVPHCKVSSWKNCPDIESASERASKPFMPVQPKFMKWTQKVGAKLKYSGEQRPNTTPRSIQEGPISIKVG